MNRHQFKINFAAKSKARSFATMGNGFLDGFDAHKMEETLQLWKQTLETERKERKNRGGQVWKSGQTGKLATYANTVLQSKLSNKKVGKVKMLTDEKITLPNRNESSSLSKKLSDISNHSTGTFKSSSSSSKSHGKLCGQCESNGAALCCIQCTEVYCTACFSAYHQKGALRKHRSISLEVSSTPRLKNSASSDTRSLDLPLVPTTMAKTNCQQSGSSSPSGASGASKKDEEKTLCRIDDNYNEAESAASFQEAVMAWRTNNYATSEAASAASVGVASVASVGVASVASVGVATCLDDSNQRPPSLDEPKKNAAIYTTSGTSTMEVTGDLASVMANSQVHTLSYAEQLLVRRNRRIPITWKSDNADAFDAFGKRENSDETKRLETEESLTISDPTETLERLNIDEPVTFSSLYHLVAQDTEDSNNSSFYEQEILPDSFKKVQNEPVKSDEFSRSSNEIFPQRRASVVPLIQSFPEKNPSSLAGSESDEKGRIQSGTSHPTGKKIPTNRVKTPKNPRPKSRTSSRKGKAWEDGVSENEQNHTSVQQGKARRIHNGQPFVGLIVEDVSATWYEQAVPTNIARPSNLTTTPSKSLQMVSHLVKYQHDQNDDQQPSLLMAGLGKDVTNPNEASPRERRKSNNGPDNAMRVSYTLYKMSPCSWRPDQSINQNLAESQFHPSDSLSDKSRPGKNNDKNGGSASINEAQYVLPAFNPSANTIDDEEAFMVTSTEAVGNLPATQSLYDQDAERRVSPLELTETPQILACLNNTAMTSQHEEEYEPIFPNSLLKGQLEGRSHSVVSSFRSETASPTQTDSPSPVHSARNTHRSKTMPEIATTNEDDKSASARSLQRNKSLSPDFMVKTIKDIMSAPMHSVKYSPKIKSILMVPLEENASSVRSSTCSAVSMDSRADATDNFLDISIHSATNTPRTDRETSGSILVKKHENHSLLSRSTEITPKSKQISTIHAHQDGDCHVKRAAAAVRSFKGPSRSKSASPIPASLKPKMKISDALTPRLSQIDSNEKNVSEIPAYSPRNLQQRSKSAVPMSDTRNRLGETPLESATSPLCSATVTSVDAMTENGSSLSVLSKEGTPRNKTYSPILTIDDSQPFLFDTPVLTAKSTSMSPVTITSTLNCNSNNSISSGRNISKSYVPKIIDSQEAISYTPVSSLRNKLISPDDTQENNSDIPVSPIHPITDTQENIGDTPIHSVRSILRSPIDTIIDTQENIRDTPIMSVKYPPISPVPAITDIQKSITNTTSNSIDNMPMSPVPTVLDNHERISDTPLLSMKNTPEFSIPTIFDGNENISDTSITFVESTPISPVSTIVGAQESLSISSMRDTPKRQKSETITRNSPMSHDETFEYKSLIHQMMVNNKLNSFSSDSEDEAVVSLLPSDTDQTENGINFGQLNSPSPPARIIPMCTETNTISNTCTVTHSSSTSVPMTSGVNSPVSSGETHATHDKMNTIFYMCNSDLYPADGSPQPIHDAGAKLKRNPTSTKKYIIPRPPEHPHGTKHQNSSSPRSDDLHPTSASTSTSSSLEMKRSHFKQSNQGKNAVSIKEMTSNTEQGSLIPDLGRLSPCQSEELIIGPKEEDHESVFSSLTKLSVDSLDDEKRQNVTFNEDDCFSRDDFQTEIDEMEDQIAEEMKLKALK